MLLSSAYGQTAAQEVLANPNKRTFSYDELLGAYTGVFFGTRPTPTAASYEIETVSLPLSGKDGNESKVAYDVKVGFVGNEVYIQGIYKDMPDAWIRGEFNEGKTEVSFPYGQCLGVDSEGWNIYLAGDEGTGDSYAIAPVVFSYDASYNYFELQNTLYLMAARTSSTTSTFFSRAQPSTSRPMPHGWLPPTRALPTVSR